MYKMRGGWKRLRSGKRGRLKKTKCKTANDMQRGGNIAHPHNKKGGYTAKYLDKILVGSVGRSLMLRECGVESKYLRV